MKGKFSKTEMRGLPGGPNQQFTYVTGVFMQDMYHAPMAQQGLETPDPMIKFNELARNRELQSVKPIGPMKKWMYGKSENEAQDFLTKMVNSPLFEERYNTMRGYKTPASKEEIDSVKDTMKYNIQNVDYWPVGFNPHNEKWNDSFNASAWYNADMNYPDSKYGINKVSKNFRNSDIGYIPHTIFRENDEPTLALHEASHASMNFGFPDNVDIYFSKDPLKQKAVKKYKSQYHRQGEEMKAYLDELRKHLYDENLYDATTKKFDEKDYDNLLKEYDRVKKELKKNPKDKKLKYIISTFRKFIEPYDKKQTIQAFNSFVDNTSNEDLPIGQEGLEKYQTKGEYNFNDLISKYQKSGWESLTKDEQDLYRDNYDNLYYDEKQKSWRSDKPVSLVTADATGRYKELGDYRNWLTDWYSSDIARNMITEGYRKEYEGTDYEGSVDPRQLAQENLQERIKNISGRKELEQIDPNNNIDAWGYVMSQSDNKFDPIYKEWKKYSNIQKNIDSLDNAYFDAFIKSYDYDIFDNVRESLKPDFGFPYDTKSNKLRSSLYKNAVKKAYDEEFEEAMQRKKESDIRWNRSSDVVNNHDYTVYPDKDDVVRQTRKLEDFNDSFRTIYYDPKTDEYTIPHELGHLSTGSLNLIPNQDIRLIQEEVPFINDESRRVDLLQRFGPRDLFGKPIKKEISGKPTKEQHGYFRSLPFSYYDNPTEVQTRLNVARYQAKDKIGWDPTKRKATIEDVMKLKELNESNIQDLFDNYSPEHILKMLNSVAMEDQSQDMYYGQKGVESKDDYKNYVYPLGNNTYQATPYSLPVAEVFGNPINTGRQLLQNIGKSTGYIADQTGQYLATPEALAAYMIDKARGKDTEFMDVLPSLASDVIGRKSKGQPDVVTSLTSDDWVRKNPGKALAAGFLMPGFAFGKASKASKFKPKIGKKPKSKGYWNQFMENAENIKNYREQLIKDLTSEEGLKRLKQQEYEYAKREFPDSKEEDLRIFAEKAAFARINDINNMESLNEYAKRLKPHLKGDLLKQFELRKPKKKNAYYSPSGLRKDNIDYSYSEEQIRNAKGFSSNHKSMTAYDPFFYDDKAAFAHEYGHAIQAGRALPVDDELRNLIEPIKGLSLNTDSYIKHMENRHLFPFTNPLDYTKAVLNTITRPKKFSGYNYFKSGSRGLEPSAMANELRQNMIDRGILKSRYDEVTPEKLKLMQKSKKINPGDKREKTRILDFMQNTESNYENLSKIMNKLPVVLPAAIGLSALEKEKQGGEGYRIDAPNYNDPYKVIPSGNITMTEQDGGPLKKGPLLGIDNMGNQQMMFPGYEYQFPGDMVMEIPVAQSGLNITSSTAKGGKLKGDDIRGKSLNQRLYESITPIGYDWKHALKEFRAGKRLPFKWDGEDTTFEDFDKMDRWRDPETGELSWYGKYVKEASDDHWNYYLNKKQKYDTFYPSKYKPTTNTGEDVEYMQFEYDDDIFDEADRYGMFDEKVKVGTNKQVTDSAAGGFTLKDYTLSRGRDEKGDYISYYDKVDFAPSVMGMKVPVEKFVGKPYDFYGRMYYTKEGDKIKRIFPKEKQKGGEFQKLVNKYTTKGWQSLTDQEKQTYKEMYQQYK